MNATAPVATAPVAIAPVRPPMLAIAALLAMAVLAQGISAPFQKDAEPQSAQWIQSIVRDGRWMIPKDAYGFVDRKPPLFYWMAAAAADAAGGVVDETRARAVSLAAGTALATIVLAWTAANVGAAEGWLAFFFLLGTYGFASRATVALTDMLLTFLLMAAYCVLFPQIEGRGSMRRAAAAGGLLGLGVLAKGPVAVVLVGLAVLIYLLIVRGDPIAILRTRWPWAVLGIALAIGAVYYAALIVPDRKWMLTIVLNENFGHFVPHAYGGTGEGNRPFYFIAARLLGGAFPMVMLVPPTVLAFWTREMAGGKRRAVIYQAAMALAVLLFFSVASVKRDDYILPALPGIAILCASVFTLGGERGAAAILRDVIVVVFTAGAAIAMLAALSAAAVRGGAVPSGLHLQSSDAAFAAIFMRGLAAPWWSFLLCAIGLIAAAVLAVRSFGRGNPFYEGCAIAVAGLAGSLLWTSTLRPELAALRSLKGFVPRIAQTIKGAPLCIPAGINYELSFYYGAAVPDVASGRCPQPAPGRPVYLMATPRELAAMPADYRDRLKLVLQSGLIGGAGSPVLFEILPRAYEIAPHEAGPDLKPGGAGAK